MSLSGGAAQVLTCRHSQTFHDILLGYQASCRTHFITTGEAKLKYAPEGSILKQIFDTKISGQQDVSDLGGPKGMMEVLAAGEAVYSGDLETVLALDGYPCSVTDIKGIR